MTSYKTDQEFIVHHNRTFHFVSYEGQRAHLATNKDEVRPSWFLMAAGKRVMVMEQMLGVERDELHRQLTEWLDQNVFAGRDPRLDQPVMGVDTAPAQPKRRRRAR